MAVRAFVPRVLSGRCPRFAVVLLAILTLAWSGVHDVRPLSGQEPEEPPTDAEQEVEVEPAAEPERTAALGGRWFPARSLVAAPLADPRAPALRGAIIRTERDRGERDPFVEGDFEGMNLEAEVALGHRLPVFLLRRGDDGRYAAGAGAGADAQPRGPAVAIEFSVAVFSRFFLESRQNDLINTDYRVGFPITAGWRGWEGMLELRHISSHVGDDFAERFGADDREVSLDGLELLLARRMGDGLRAYVGGEWNLRSTTGIETHAGRVGIEYDPGSVDPARRVWPYAAADLRVNDAVRRAEGTGVVGLALRFRQVGLRFEATGHFGPSAMGWLRTSDETYWGLGISLAPRGF